MVYTPPHVKRKRAQLRLELYLLELKRKIFGNLSESDMQRRKEIIAELSIHY